jgi:SAM-dependent methyltransferase
MIGRLSAAISRQLSHPTGRGGRVIAALMNRGNRALNTRAIDLLDVQPSSRVLDLGFGGGLTFPALLDRAATVTGVDRAHDMVDAASARYADAVAAGRLAVHAGEVTALPLADDAVDRVLTVNTVYFWRDLPAAFGELRRVLAPGGRLVIGIRDGSVMDRVNPEVFTIRPARELADALGDAGFTGADVVSAPDGKTHLVTASVLVG